MTQATFVGRIEVSPAAIATLAGQAVLECYGVVGMANKNVRDGIAEILPHGNYHRGVDVHVIEREIVIDLYVVIQYGTRISEVSHGIMSRVKFSLEKTVGLSVRRVNVHVQGLHVDDRKG